MPCDSRVGRSQMFAPAKLADTVKRVKPKTLRQGETKPGELKTSIFRRHAGTVSCESTSTIPTARCGPACRVVWEGSVRFPDRPYPDLAEREGFEPSIRFTVYTLSRRAPSTTRPSLRKGRILAERVGRRSAASLVALHVQAFPTAPKSCCGPPGAASDWVKIRCGGSPRIAGW